MKRGIQLVNDCTSDQDRNAVEFYLDMPLLTISVIMTLLFILKVAFQSGETFS